MLKKLKRRNQTEVLPFQNLFEMQTKLLEQNINLKTENSSLNFITEKLKEENLHLKSKSSSSENSSQNNENFLELQKKLFNVQEELTELHRYVRFKTSFVHFLFILDGKEKMPSRLLIFLQQ